MFKNNKFESLTNQVSIILFALGITLAILGYVNQSQETSNSSKLNEINSSEVSQDN